MSRKLAYAVLFALVFVILRLRYSLKIKNLPANDGRPVLFLPNHPALIDPVILCQVLGPDFRPRPLADAGQAARPGVKQALGLINAIVIPDASQSGRQALRQIEQGLSLVAQALEHGDNVIFYPSGRIYHSRMEAVGGNSGLKTVLEQMNTLPRLVLVRTTGLWGSSFSRASGSYPKVLEALKKGLALLLANLLFFIPRRQVSIEFSEPEEFRQIAASGDKQAINRYLENFYNRDAPPAMKVPFFFWQGSKPLPMPEPDEAGGQADLPVTSSVRDQVLACLRRFSGQERIEPDMLLGADLGLDSLSLVEVGLWLEGEFGCYVPDLENLLTVQDCLQAAMGINSGRQSGQKPPPPVWFPLPQDAAIKLTMPEAPLLDSTPSLPSLFLAWARKEPARPLLADRAGGMMTFRKALITVEALLPAFKKISGERVGVMLPMTPAALTGWLACMLAGKTPVMVNWTVGLSNLRHCLGLSRVKVVVSARALMNRLRRQGFDPEQVSWRDGTKVNFIYLEDVAKDLGWSGKLGAALRALFFRRLDKLAADKSHMSNTAAILFTSGSESLPKAVPLSHANIVSNLLDAVKVLDVRAGDRLLGLLPPFHSLGLLGNMALPACMGIPMACHPNPTEAAALVGLVKNYRLSLVITPPTFLGNMLQRARQTDALASLRLAFVGAEKCPESVFRDFARQCPQGALCEGYGVSECSPIVSVNHPGNPCPGTIGLPLASMEIAVVAGPDTNPGLSEYVEAAVNQPGLLLARGPNVFDGYLPAPPGYPGPSSPFMEYGGKIWYRTGDLVSRDGDSVLSFCGRLKRFIKVGGEMISLPQIEDVLLSAFAGLRGEQEGPLLAVEAVGQDAMITLFTTADVSREQANAALRGSGLSGLYNIRRTVRLEQLPLLGTGKVDYRRLEAGL
jgi:acyl-CoA synthetase (AMP-forming)/AMP-acid ligase II/1-acyl-sn-glycerol-3-phosphate acyltransferase/acyl carrier protein